jgi:hypothetical protein
LYVTWKVPSARWMTPSSEPLALPAATGALWVSTGGQKRAHWPAQWLCVGVSALNAYGVEITPFTAPASARMLPPPPDSDWMVAVPGSGVGGGGRGGRGHHHREWHGDQGHRRCQQCSSDTHECSLSDPRLSGTTTRNLTVSERRAPFVHHESLSCQRRPWLPLI